MDILDGVETINRQAFDFCEKLTSVIIPKSIKNFEGGASFSGCKSLTSIIVDKDNPYYDSRNNCNAIIETSSNKLISGCKTTIIPENVKIIGYLAFWKHDIINITIPNSVTTIEKDAFRDCSSIISITIPESVDYIYDSAFRGCSSLNSVTINKRNPISIKANVFYQNSNSTEFTNATLYVPYGCKRKYQQADGWKNFKSIIELPDPANGYRSYVNFVGNEWSAIKPWDGNWTYEEYSFIVNPMMLESGFADLNSNLTASYFYENYCAERRDNSFDLKQYVIGEKNPVSSAQRKFTSATNYKGIVSEVPTVNAGYCSLSWTITKEQIKTLWIDDVSNRSSDEVAIRFVYDPDHDGVSDDETKDIYVVLTAPLKYIQQLEPIKNYIVTVKDCQREYGEQNPIFEYTVTGGTLNGRPLIKCNAGKDAKVGTYDINIEKGDIMDKNVTLVPGTLTVTKAVLFVAANTYTITEGDDLPEFEITYSGFKNGETEAVLTKKPVIICNATKNSKPGIYGINFYDAVAENYFICYVLGNLIIEKNNNYVTKDNNIYEKEEDGTVGVKDGEPDTDGILEIRTVINTISSTDLPVVSMPVTFIADGAFQNNSEIILLILPESIQRIGCGAFAGCDNLKDIFVYSSIPATIVNPSSSRSMLCMKHSAVVPVQAFDGVDKETCVLHVPYGTADQYCHSDGWKEFKHIVEMEPTSINRHNTDNTGFNIYDMSGRMVRRLATNVQGMSKGVYIVGGRKMIVK